MAESNNIVQQPHGSQANDDTAKTSNEMAGCITPLDDLNTEQSPPGYLCLPNELVLDIFGYLPQDTLHQLRLVNRATRRLLPPQRMVLRRRSQHALFDAVAMALNAPPDSIGDLKKLAFAINDDREEICGYRVPRRCQTLLQDDKLVPAVFKLVTKLNSGASPKLRGLQMDASIFTSSQRVDLERLLLENAAQKWSINTLDLVWQRRAGTYLLKALIRKVTVLTAVQTNTPPISLHSSRRCFLWQDIFSNHATSLQKAGCVFRVEEPPYNLDDTINQIACFKQCPNLKWLVLRSVSGSRSLFSQGDENRCLAWGAQLAEAICQVPSLTQLAIVLSGYVAFGVQASPQARRAIQTVMGEQRI
ncbi:uncharacterized protein PG986_014265 [Apiospora aurea]|uniref:F-box domain-containing protein n=1 Tax=Apiospora aurea TaxID=335848 RepID=A0ABR1PSH4_9PEZI